MAEFGLVIRGEMAGTVANEGMRVRGWPMTTVSQGEIIGSEGELHAPESHDQFLRCDPPQSPPARKGRRRDP
jgi:hypothetical protein